METFTNPTTKEIEPASTVLYDRIDRGEFSHDDLFDETGTLTPVGRQLQEISVHSDDYGAWAEQILLQESQRDLSGVSDDQKIIDRDHEVAQHLMAPLMDAARAQEQAAELAEGAAGPGGQIFASDLRERRLQQGDTPAQDALEAVHTVEAQERARRSGWLGRLGVAMGYVPNLGLDSRDVKDRAERMAHDNRIKANRQ